MMRYKVSKFYSHVGDFWTVEKSNGELVGTFRSWVRAYAVADAHAQDLRETRESMKQAYVVYR